MNINKDRKTARAAPCHATHLLAGEHEAEDGAGDGPVVHGAEEELGEERGEQREDEVGLRLQVAPERVHGRAVLGLVLSSFEV
jgi:hypothetical protein